jgi:hypothetical protein
MQLRFLEKLEWGKNCSMLNKGNREKRGIEKK